MNIFVKLAKKTYISYFVKLNFSDVAALVDEEKNLAVVMISLFKLVAD